MKRLMMVLMLMCCGCGIATKDREEIKQITSDIYDEAVAPKLSVKEGKK